jgi:hypothetical protein
MTLHSHSPQDAEPARAEESLLPDRPKDQSV